MPRTLITSQVLATFPANGVVAANSFDIVFTPWDVANGNSFQSSGRDLLLVYNTDTVPHTFTVPSVPDTSGRLGDVTAYTVAAGVVSMFFLHIPALYLQTDNLYHVDASSALVKFAILKV